MKLLVVSIAISIALLAGASCTSPTSFKGEATTPQGPETCRAQCATWGMELAGMVSMGANYTDGCICAVPGQAPGSLSAAAAVTAAVAGVEMQRQNTAASQSNQSSTMPAPTGAH